MFVVLVSDIPIQGEWHDTDTPQIIAGPSPGKPFASRLEAEQWTWQEQRFLAQVLEVTYREPGI
jgi:hypothetical protein